jgi:hypothetical protein
MENRAMKKKKIGKKATAKTTNGATELPDWKSHLDSYRELCSLTFPNFEEIEKGIDLLWTEELRTLPHDLTDGHTIIMPKEAVEYFERAGLKFKARRVRRSDEISAEERTKMRREQGFIGVGFAYGF